MFTKFIDTVIFNTAKYAAKSCYMTASGMRTSAVYINKGADHVDNTGKHLDVVADKYNNINVMPVVK